MHGAEPGTGTQTAIFASPPDVDDGHPCTYRINGRTWKVGHDYLDTELGDVCVLTEVYAKSSWCDTREPEDCSPLLHFEYERYGGWDDGHVTVDPFDREADLEERFIERHEPSLPRGAPARPW